MSWANLNSIWNYTHKHIRRSYSNRQASLPKKTNPVGNKIFSQILASCELQRSHKNKIQSTGLTASDYLANPMISRMPKKSVQKASRLTAKVNSEAGIQQKQTDLFEHEIIEKSVKRAAARYNLPPELIQAVIKAESNFEVNAVSSAGAKGLMQLMPATAEELGINNPFDIDQNVDGGSRYLRKMIDRFGGDIELALAAYNAGPGTVERYKGDVPYRETRRFVNRVLRFSGQIA